MIEWKAEFQLEFSENKVAIFFPIPGKEKLIYRDEVRRVWREAHNE